MTLLPLVWSHLLLRMISDQWARVRAIALTNMTHTQTLSHTHIAHVLRGILCDAVPWLFEMPALAPELDIENF